MGLGFVAAAVLVAGSLYVGIKTGGSVELLPALSNEVVASPQNAAVPSNEVAPFAEGETTATAQLVPQNFEAPVSLRRRMVSSYFSEAVNADGHCEGSGWSFEAGGTFEIIWTRVNEVSRGRWKLEGETLSMTDIETVNLEDETIKTSESKETAVRWEKGALLIKDFKLYPCRAPE